MALIGHAIARGNNSTHAITAGFNTTGATLLIVGISENAPSSPGTLTDSYANTGWVTGTPFGVTSGRIRLYYCRTPTVGPGHTFDYGGSGIYPCLAVQAWSGYDVFDKNEGSTNEASGASAGANCYAGFGILPSENGELLAYIAGGEIWGGPVNTTLGTILDYSLLVNGESYGLASGYYEQTTAAVATPQLGWTGTLGYNGGTVMAFKAATGGGGTTYPVTIAESTTSAADIPSSFLAQFAVPIADIATNGWYPSSGGTLYPMLDEAAVDFADYISSPNNPTTQQFEVLLAPFPTSAVNTDHSIEIALIANSYDTNFDFNLVQGTTVLDSWTELVTVAQGQVVRTRNFSSAVIATITDRSDVRIRGVARA